MVSIYMPNEPISTAWPSGFYCEQKMDLVGPAEEKEGDIEMV
jgi:hypothetical protein